MEKKESTKEEMKSELKNLKKEKIDVIILLVHNFQEHILRTLKKDYDGEVMIMIPEIQKIKNVKECTNHKF